MPISPDAKRLDIRSRLVYSYRLDIRANAGKLDCLDRCYEAICSELTTDPAMASLTIYAHGIWSALCDVSKFS